MCLKILRVTSDLYPDVVGGIGLHAHEMYRLQVKSGHQVTIFTSVVNGNTKNENTEGYQIFRFKNTFKLLGNSISIPLVRRLFKERKNYDIIHAHSHLFFSTNVCALLRKFGSPPLVITNHGLISQTAPLWLQKIFIPTIAKWTFKAADGIICYTDSEKSKLVELGIKPEKIYVVHNGIDTDLFVPAENKEITSQILWIGRFTPGKGVDYLIDGFTLLVQEHPEVRLLMIGRGPQKEECSQKMHDLGLSDKVTIRDFVPNSELPKIYQDSDVFVLPSINEGIPRTILESMSSGVPVVCTELPQLVDIVTGCGLLIPLRDSQAVSDAVSKILADQSLANTLGKNGREKMITHFSWEDTVKQTLLLYEELIT